MGQSIDMVPIPLARRRAPEKVLMQSTPAASSNCATSPLAALAMNTGTRRATLSRSLSRISAREVRRTIMGASYQSRRLTSRALTYVEPRCIRPLRMDMSKDLVAASATPLVLAILAEGDSYGYAIIKRVAELSGGHLQWTDGMLYPVLHRLERQGHVAAKWSASENGRRRRYYRITREGRAQLAAQRQQWQVVDGTLRGIWMNACTA